MRMAQASRELWICRLGTVSYREAMAMQHDVRARRWACELPDVMLLLEHPPTYTRGRRSDAGELPFAEQHYHDMGIEVVRTDRGGRVTYHGPGQLVGYTIMAVSDVVAHVRTIEAALVAALADQGIEARSRASEGPDYTGVWVGERKIASIGVHLSRGVTTHGFAINVQNDLAPFSWIVPCGLHGVVMTSVARERARSQRWCEDDDGGEATHAFERLRGQVERRFSATAGRRARIVCALELGLARAGDASDTAVPSAKGALPGVGRS